MKHLQLTLYAAVAATVALPAGAVPAKPGPMSMTCPDGTQLTVSLRGDESFHQYFTEDGYPLIECDGLFYYCDIDANGNLVDSGIKACDINKRDARAEQFLSTINTKNIGERISLRAQKANETASNLAYPVKAPKLRADSQDGPPYERGYGLFPDIHGPIFPSYGDRKALVILVEYADAPFSTPEPLDYFSRMLNEEGFNDYGATGSAADYFKHSSNNVFRPQFDVYGPVKLPKNKVFYGGNNSWGNDRNPHRMVIDALNLLDDSVDFSQYDCDGDGQIDNVFIFFAGKGENNGGGANSVWPHSNDLSKLGESGHIYDGVEVQHYACTNEWTGDRPDGIGTFVHEFGHVMGLPDLYAVEYGASFTPDKWAVMDYGSYNNESMTPPQYGAFERYALGWMQPREIDRAISATLPEIGDNVAGIIRTDTDTEFFLVENRRQTGWDEFIPGHGMLVWHIDYNASIWNSNKVNNTPSHQYVDLVEADDLRSESTRAGDSFPGTAGITSFTSTTSPSMTTWGNQAVDFPITDIAETDGGQVTFNVLGGSDDRISPVTLLEPTGITHESFTINWEMQDNNFDYIISVYTKNADSDEKEYADGYNYLNVGKTSSKEITGLQPENTYYYTVIGSNGWVTGEVGETGTVTTDRLNLSYKTPLTLPASDITLGGFTANWEPLDDANDYLLTVYEKIINGHLFDTCDFTGGVTRLPKGWLSSSTIGYGMASYCGESAPSLRLGSGGYISTPLYEGNIHGISFWCRGNGTGADDKLRLECLTENGWLQFSEIPVDKASGGRNVNVTIDGTEPFGSVTSVRLTFIPESGGSLAIDDIKVEYGETYVSEKVPGFDAVSTGNNTTYEVSGLKGFTTYQYTIKATDGTLISHESDMEEVTTGLSSVISVKDDKGLVVNGRTIISEAEMVVYDVSGRTVATGRGHIRVATPGLYLVRIDNTGHTARIIIK